MEIELARKNTLTQKEASEVVKIINKKRLDVLHL